MACFSNGTDLGYSNVPFGGSNAEVTRRAVSRRERVSTGKDDGRMALIGVLARVDVARRSHVSEEIGHIRGVSLFSVAEEERIGILVERDSLSEVHAALKDEVEAVPGILGAWPVFSYAGEYADEGSELNESSVDDRLVVDNTHIVEADVDG